MINRFCILFCCQKASITYMTKYKPVSKCIFQENVGRRYLVKLEFSDKEIINQYQQACAGDSIYVIDIKDNIIEDNETNVDKVNLNHMGIILIENNSTGNMPNLNIYNIGVLCFMSCVNCHESGCPGKSPCSKLATDILRLWNTLAYQPGKLKLETIKQIQKGIQEMYYNQENQIHKTLPQFIKNEICGW